MIGVLGHDSALLRLYWARDNLGEWDEFCYESCPWPRINRSTCWPAVQHCTTDASSIIFHISHTWSVGEHYITYINSHTSLTTSLINTCITPSSIQSKTTLDGGWLCAAQQDHMAEFTYYGAILDYFLCSRLHFPIIWGSVNRLQEQPRATVGNTGHESNQMNGVSGYDSALLRLYWAGDNLGEWDGFCYESCPWRRITRSTYADHDNAILLLLLSPCW